MFKTRCVIACDQCKEDHKDLLDDKTIPIGWILIPDGFKIQQRLNKMSGNSTLTQHAVVVNRETVFCSKDCMIENLHSLVKGFYNKDSVQRLINQ